MTKPGLKFTMVSFEGDFPAFGMQISQQKVERSLETRLVLGGPGYNIRLKKNNKKQTLVVTKVTCENITFDKIWYDDMFSSSDGVFCVLCDTS